MGPLRWRQFPQKAGPPVRSLPAGRYPHRTVYRVRAWDSPRMARARLAAGLFLRGRCRSRLRRRGRRLGGQGFLLDAPVVFRRTGHAGGDFCGAVGGKGLGQVLPHGLQPLRVVGQACGHGHHFIGILAAHCEAAFQEEVEIPALAAAHGVDEHHGQVLISRLGRTETTGLGNDEVRCVHVLVHVGGVAQAVSRGSFSSDRVSRSRSFRPQMATTRPFSGISAVSFRTILCMGPAPMLPHMTNASTPPLRQAQLLPVLPSGVRFYKRPAAREYPGAAACPQANRH